MLKNLIRKVLKLSLPTLFIALSFSATAYGADVYWEGGNSGCNASWATAACWSTATVPGFSDNVYFTNADTTNCTLSANVTINSFIMQSGYTGTVNASSRTITLTGDFNKQGGTYSSGSNITFSGGTTQNIVLGGGTISFTNVTVNKSIGSTVSTYGMDLDTINMTGTLTVTSGKLAFENDLLNLSGALSIGANGEFDAGSSEVNLSAGMTISAGGKLTPGTSTVTFTGTSNRTITIPSTVSASFYDLEFNVGGTGDITIGSSSTITVTNSLTLTNGLFWGTPTTSKIVLTGSIFDYQTTFRGNYTGETGRGGIELVCFSDNKTYTIPSITGTNKSIPGFHLNKNGKDNCKLEYLGNDDITFEGLFKISGTGTNSALIPEFESTNSRNLTFDGAFVLESGTFKTNGATMVYTNTVTITGGTYQAGTSSISLTNASSGLFTQSGGTFNATDATLSVAYQTNHTAGIFNAPSGTMTVTGATSLNPDFFNVNNGTIVLKPNGYRTFSLNGSTTTLELYNLTFDATSDVNSFRVETDKIIKVNNILDLTNGKLELTNSNSYLIANKSLIWRDTFDGGNTGDGAVNSRLVIKTDTDVSIPTPVGLTQSLPPILLDNTNKSNLTLTYSGSKTLSMGRLDILNTGGLGELASGGIFQHTGTGAINMTAATRLFAGEFKVGTGITATLNGTLTIENNAIFDVQNSTLVATGTITQSGGVFNAELGQITSTGAITHTAGIFKAPQGNFSIGASITVNPDFFVVNNGTIILRGGSNNNFSLNGLTTTINLYNVTIDKTSESWWGVQENKTMVVNNVLDLTNGKLSFSNSNSKIIANKSVIWRDTFDGGSTGDGSSTTSRLIIKTDSDLSIPASLSTTGRTWPPIALDNSNKSNLLVSYFGAENIIIGRFNIYNTGGLGELASGAKFENTGSGNITFAGFSGPTLLSAGEFKVGSGREITLSQTLTLENNAIFNVQDSSLTTDVAHTFSAGVFDATNATLDFNNTLTLSGGTFKAPSTNMYLTTSLIINTGAVFEHNNGTIIFDGSTNSTYTNSSLNAVFNNILINKTTTTNGITTMNNNMTLDGDLILTRGILTMGSRTITLKGDWTRSNTDTTFNANTGTVIFNGTSQTISGNNTFRNFTKPSNSELIFEAGSTTTITGIWEAKGTSTSSRLLLRSSIPGTGLSENQWKIDPQGTIDIAFLDVQDSNNIKGNPVFIKIDARGTGSIPAETSPNNTNWLFDMPIPGPITQIGPRYSGDISPTLRWFALSGDIVKYTIDVTTVSDTKYETIIETIVIAQPFTIESGRMSVAMTQTLAFSEYRWRIYAEDSSAQSGLSLIVDGTGEIIAGGDMLLDIVNIIPEYNTYLYALMFILGAFFIYKQKVAKEIN